MRAASTQTAATSVTSNAVQVNVHCFNVVGVLSSWLLIAKLLRIFVNSLTFFYVFETVLFGPVQMRSKAFECVRMHVGAFGRLNQEILDYMYSFC